MPRIRTFKPEFFRSPDTAKASWGARLLYMALWSWANDEGIGETNLYGLLGFAFPDSDELTVKDLQRLLKEVRGSYGVLFYSHRNRYYYAVPTWDSHQKTERRAAGKFPKPNDPDSVPDLRFGDSADGEGFSATGVGSSASGTGEQGNRGITVETTEVCHQGDPTVAPPQKCSRHTNMLNPPDCGGCASASREFKAWKRRQEEAEREAATLKEQARQDLLALIQACPMCDDLGRVELEDGLAACPEHPSLKAVG